MSNNISGLGTLYSRALDGLTASQKGLTVASNNIANVNTPGYARQQLILGTRAARGDGSLGGGVFAQGVQGFVNPFVERQLIDEQSQYGLADGRRLTMSFMEDLVGEINGQGIGSSITGFFNSWSQLATDPSNGALRQGVRESGTALVDKFRSTNSQLQQLRTNLSNNIDATIEGINSNLQEVARLNKLIQNSTDQATVMDLKSTRNVVMQKLSKDIGVNYFEDQQGQMIVQASGSGFPLVNGSKASTLSGSSDLSIGGIHTINATIPGSSNPANVDITQNVKSGRLGAFVIDRNETVNNRLAELDQLAYEIALQVNTVHQDGFGLDGATGRNFFAPLAGPEGAASLFALDNSILGNLDAIAAAGDDPAITGVGDSDNANAIIALQNTKFLSGGTQTFNEFISGFRSKIGMEAARVNSEYEARANLVNRLEIQRQNISGVNLDEEAMELIKFQRAFEGSARVMQAANQLFQVLLEL